VTGLVLRELTSTGRGAIRVLELRGPDALARVSALAPGRMPPPGTFRPVALRSRAGELLDEAIVLVDAPERVELHLHGAEAVVRRVAAELGLELAPRGGAGGPRSLEARAEERLSGAPSEAAARVLLDQAGGALRRALEAFLAMEAAARAEAAAELARRGRVALRLLAPPCVVLAGPVNAGKSTLFNLLVGRERVVVDREEGTTRDAVLERVLLGAYAIDLVDTAGERVLPAGEEADLEHEGQRLGRALRRNADLTRWLVPPGAPAPRPGPSLRVVRSRADEEDPPPVALPGARLSARDDPEGARTMVQRIVLEALELPPDPWSPGAGVPFEIDWVEALERSPAPELAARVRGWLADGAD